MGYQLNTAFSTTELQTNRGDPYTPMLCFLFSNTYPSVSAFSIWQWNDSSTATTDGTTILASTTGDPSTGRWFLIDRPHIVPDWLAVSGTDQYIANKPSVGKAVVGTTVKTGVFPVIKSQVVSSSTAVFYLTSDGTSTGTALFSEVYMDSVQVSVNDSSTLFTSSVALTNGTKTLTVTLTKIGVVNLVTGAVGTVAANGATVSLTVFGA